MADAGVPQAMGAQKCAVSDGGEGAVSFFLKEYEGLEDVVSDRFLASFLDMSPETLSRQKRCLREEKPD